MMKVIGAQPRHLHSWRLALAMAHIDKTKAGHTNKARLPRGKIGATGDPLPPPQHSRGDVVAIHVRIAGRCLTFGQQRGRELFVRVEVEYPRMTKRDALISVVSLPRERVEWPHDDAGPRSLRDFVRPVGRTGVEDND